MHTNDTEPNPGHREILFFDDSPLDAILYGGPGSASSADLFAIRADERDAIARAWVEGRIQDALRRTDDLLASGGALTERETLTTLSRISELIPECGWPMIPAGSYPYASILGEVFDRALRAGKYALAGEVGLVLARSLEACGRFDGSSEVFRTLLTLARVRSSLIEIAQYANNLGYALAQRGLWSEAERCCEEAVAGFTAIEALGRANNARANLLSARLDLHGFPDATALEPEIEEVDRYYARTADWRQRKTLVLLARIREHVGDLDLALQLMEQALRVARKVKTRHRLEDAAYRRKLRDRIAREVACLDEQVRVEGFAGLNRGSIR
jgi:tetratricopeptide (TPR) repeat protein